LLSADNEQVCISDYTSDGLDVCRPLCTTRGEFSLPGMKTCHQWLTCDDIDSVRLLTEIGSGLVKKVNL